MPRPSGGRLRGLPSSPGPRRPRISREVPQGRLALDRFRIDRLPDLLLDPLREVRSDRRELRELVRVRLLKVPEGLVAPLERGPGPPPPDPAEGHELEEFLLHAVLRADREPREVPYLLLGEDPPQFGHGEKEPLRLVRHPPDLPGADAALL